MTWILVAEDNDDLRAQLAEALREHGYCVQAAADGAEAVQMLDEAVEMPALVLLDLVMPGVTGREVLRAMRRLERSREVPVVALSAVTMGDDELTELAVFAAFLKPTPVEPLFATIDRICGKPS